MSHTTDDPRSLERDLAREAVTVSGARPTDNVTIAGTAHIEIVIELVRRGFSHVVCQSAINGPHMAAPPADLLIAPNVKSETELRSVLKRLAHDLRPRGVLVISCAAIGSSLSERCLRRLLMEEGFSAVERSASRGDVGTLWCAHKARAALARAA